MTYEAQIRMNDGSWETKWTASDPQAAQFQWYARAKRYTWRLLVDGKVAKGPKK